MPSRTYWRAEDLAIKNEPLIKSLIEYRQKKNRKQVREVSEPGDSTPRWDPEPNLISSLTHDGKQMPIIDMDFPHHYEASTSDGHSHLYVDIPMSRWRWFVLMCALRYTGVIELGFFVWSLRRGANFVRLPGVKKVDGAESVKPEYGWFWKLRKHE